MIEIIVALGLLIIGVSLAYWKGYDKGLTKYNPPDKEVQLISRIGKLSSGISRIRIERDHWEKQYKEMEKRWRWAKSQKDKWRAEKNRLQKMISEQNVQESDTTGDAQGTKAS